MILLRIALILIVGFLLLAAYVRFYESRSIYFPDKELESTPQDLGLNYEDLYFRTADGMTLNGWLVGAKPGRPTLIFCHGNAGNISHRLDKISIFCNLGINVFIFDYRGYGRSEGQPSEQGLYDDAAAAYDYLVSRNDMDTDKIIIYGCSLVGAVATDLAARHKIAALILDSTFPSAVDMAKVILPFAPSFLIRSKMDSATKIKHILAPKLFIHSPEDEIVPFALGQKLFQAAPPPKQMLKISGDHNYGYTYSVDVFSQGINEFLTHNGLI